MGLWKWDFSPIKQIKVGLKSHFRKGKKKGWAKAQPFKEKLFSKSLRAGIKIPVPKNGGTKVPVPKNGGTEVPLPKRGGNKFPLPKRN